MCKHFHEKLRKLKFTIRNWSNTNVGNINSKIKTLGQTQDQANDEEWDDRDKAEVKSSLEKLYEVHSLSLKQKSRFNWNKFGDRNTSFFHESVTRRRKRNNIVGVFHEKKWFTRPEEIKDIFLRHFSSFFSADGNKPQFLLGSIKLPCLTH